jgi:sulfoxide reductase catalytic subunit YedY
MVIPWQGFPISRILDKVIPNGEAKYLRFETVKRPDEMPGIPVTKCIRRLGA